MGHDAVALPTTALSPVKKSEYEMVQNTSSYCTKPSYLSVHRGHSEGNELVTLDNSCMDANLLVLVFSAPKLRNDLAKFKLIVSKIPRHCKVM